MATTEERRSAEGEAWRPGPGVCAFCGIPDQDELHAVGSGGQFLVCAECALAEPASDFITCRYCRQAAEAPVTYQGTPVHAWCREELLADEEDA